MSGSTRIHSSHWWTDRHEGPSRGNIKTTLAGGKGKNTNRDMIRGTVSLCVTVCDCVWKTKEREGYTDTERKGGTLQYDKWVEWKRSVVAACVVDSDGR